LRERLQRLRRLWLRLLPVMGVLPNLLGLRFPITLQDAGRHGRVSNPAIDVLRVADPTKKCQTAKRRTPETLAREGGGAELWRRCVC
jgi:hypothetical protein